MNDPDEPEEPPALSTSFLSSRFVGRWINRFALACGLAFLVVALLHAAG
jgi:hypothetical protein